MTEVSEKICFLNLLPLTIKGSKFFQVSPREKIANEPALMYDKVYSIVQ